MELVSCCGLKKKQDEICDFSWVSTDDFMVDDCHTVRYFRQHHAIPRLMIIAH